MASSSPARQAGKIAPATSFSRAAAVPPTRGTNRGSRRAPSTPVVPRARLTPVPLPWYSGGGLGWGFEMQIRRDNSKHLTRFARQMRRESTDAEKRLWDRLRQRQVEG